MNKDVKELVRQLALETARDEMIDRMKYMTVEQINAVSDLVRALASNPGKGALMKLAFDDEARGVDSALPHDWVVKVQKDLPIMGISFDISNYAMSYRSETPYGGIVNLKEMIINNLIKILNR